MRDLIVDFVAEQAVLDRAVAGLCPEQWDAPSPAEGWTLRDCVVHLAEVDEAAGIVVAERQFPGLSGPAGDGPPGKPGAMVRAESMTTANVLAWWREVRARLVAAAAPLDPRERLPWPRPSPARRAGAARRRIHRRRDRTVLPCVSVAHQYGHLSAGLRGIAIARG